MLPPLPPCGDDNTLRFGNRKTRPPPAGTALKLRGTAGPSCRMRTYYRHARVIYRRAALLMEHLPAPVSFCRFAPRAAPIAGTDFLLDWGRIGDQPTPRNLMTPQPFCESFRSWLRLACALAVPRTASPSAARHRHWFPSRGPLSHRTRREVLLGPHAAHALRTMHALRRPRDAHSRVSRH